MKPEQLEELLCYRMEQAHETLREAEILLNKSALRGTINRVSSLVKSYRPIVSKSRVTLSG
jgi:hypothetical protein